MDTFGDIGPHRSNRVAWGPFLSTRWQVAAVTFRKLAALPRGDDDDREEDRSPLSGRPLRKRLPTYAASNGLSVRVW